MFMDGKKRMKSLGWQWKIIKTGLLRIGQWDNFLAIIGLRRVNKGHHYE
jgi:hypothetical protein